MNRHERRYYERNERSGRGRGRPTEDAALAHITRELEYILATHGKCPRCHGMTSVTVMDGAFTAECQRCGVSWGVGLGRE